MIHYTNINRNFSVPDILEDGVIKSIDNRGWDVSHAIGWKKFEAGMV